MCVCACLCVLVGVCVCVFCVLCVCLWCVVSRVVCVVRVERKLEWVSLETTGMQKGCDVKCPDVVIPFLHAIWTTNQEPGSNGDVEGRVVSVTMLSVSEKWMKKRNKCSATVMRFQVRTKGSPAPIQVLNFLFTTTLGKWQRNKRFLEQL